MYHKCSLIQRKRKSQGEKYNFDADEDENLQQSKSRINAGLQDVKAMIGRVVLVLQMEFF